MAISDYQQVLDEITAEIQPLLGQGKVADYIPALAKEDASQFSIAIHTVDGRTFCAGDCSKRFTIQSVSKVMTLTLALQRYGDELWQRVGKEPSGTAFNSLTQLEFEKGIPRNWEGVVVLEDRGFLIIADTYPRSLFSFVPFRHN